ncbi:MAG: glutamate-5-semialdehyde dehydrogenase [Candidatus Bathyarchaeia archaeon]
MLNVAGRARAAALRMSNASTETKDRALLSIAEKIERERPQLEQVNTVDVDAAVKAGLAAPLIKRLKLDTSKINDMIKGLRSLAALEDPVGKTLLATEMDEGLELYKVTCPIGVIGAIFESRPDALVQIASLCLKSGNAVILKGGSEASETNRFLAGLIRETIKRFDEIPEDSVQLVETREDFTSLLKLDGYIDLLIPRGSSSLVKYIKDNSKIPVLGHTEGICHEYVDAYADVGMAVEICYDAKVQYPAVCNAMETLLVHKDVAGAFLPRMAERYREAGVELRGDARTREILPDAKEATEEDWRTEYLDLVLSIKVVDSMEEAVEHINRYGSHHTDGIVTQNRENARNFLKKIDSAVVLHNASTRFSDGYRFGFGAEVGISTEKIHARGPVGLEGLVTYKYIVAGSGQVVSSYIGEDARRFTHRRLSKTW